MVSTGCCRCQLDPLDTPDSRPELILGQHRSLGRTGDIASALRRNIHLLQTALLHTPCTVSIHYSRHLRSLAHRTACMPHRQPCTALQGRHRDRPGLLGHSFRSRSTQRQNTLQRSMSHKVWCCHCQCLPCPPRSSRTLRCVHPVRAVQTGVRRPPRTARACTQHTES